MNVKEILKRLEASSEFKGWRKRNKGAYLSSAFLMLNGSSNWLLSYYDRKANMMTSFEVGDAIAVRENEEVFKEPKAVVKKLDVAAVAVTAEKALAAAGKAFEKDQREPFKKIVVLQNLDAGQVWNITFLLKDLTTVNFKIDAKSGKLLSQKSMTFFESKAG